MINQEKKPDKARDFKYRNILYTSNYFFNAFKLKIPEILKWKKTHEILLYRGYHRS